MRLVDGLYSERSFLLTNGLRVISAVSAIYLALEVRQQPHLLGLNLVTLTVLTMWYHFRNFYGLDGSDQMTLIVCTSLALMSLVPHARCAAVACIWFIALQSALSYFTAGVAKVISSEWRRGSSLTGVMNTGSYGHKAFAEFLLNRPIYAKVLSWLLIGFECLFPLALFMGKYCVVFLIGGLIFHLLNAAIMGLNTFVWAFLATYPSVLFCALQIRGQNYPLWF
jgi:hypothetical protein